MKKSNLSICALVLISIAFSECKKESIAYVSDLNGHKVVICPVNKAADTIHLPLSTLVEFCEIVKLETIDLACYIYSSYYKKCLKTYSLCL